MEVAPPGLADIIIRPTLYMGSISDRAAIANAIPGRRSIWQKIPIVIALGWVNTLRKSLALMLKPMPSVMMAMVIGNNMEENIFSMNHEGHHFFPEGKILSKLLLMNFEYFLGSSFVL